MVVPKTATTMVKVACDHSIRGQNVPCRTVIQSIETLNSTPT